MRTGAVSCHRSGTSPPRFRRVPFGRDGVFDHGRATAPRLTVPHMLPSATLTASASAGLLLSRLNSPPHTVKRQAIGTPDRHAKRTPHRRWDRLVPVANRRVPRASRSALTSDGARRVGGACLPTGASRGGTYARCLKRQLSLPVSMISQ